MNASVWRYAAARGLAQGRAEAWGLAQSEARLLIERELCLDVVREYHPSLLPLATPAIEGQQDALLLKEWILSAPRDTTESYARRLGVASEPLAEAAGLPELIAKT